MQSSEERKAYYRVIVRTAYTTDFVYLGLHLIYMIFFIIAKANIMLIVNSASIIAYLLFLIVLKKGQYYLYTLLCGNEFLIFMSIATISFGFSAGFQLCLIGLTVVSFFVTYFSSKNNSLVNSLIWSGLSAIIYLFLHLYCTFNSPIYVVDNWIIITFSSMHALIAFAFIAAYMMIFIKYVTKLESRIINESRIDNLTQLHNRHDMYNFLDSIEDKKDYALTIFDIDDFKIINDEYGHLCGDYILKEIAKIASDSLKDAFVCRYGGEEFIAIIKMYSDINEVYNMLEEFRKRIDEYEFNYDDKKIHVTITLGIKEYTNKMSVEEWIDFADKKLYEGKNSGKNILFR